MTIQTRFFLLTSLLLITFCLSPAWAGPVPVTSSMNPVGSGARALGMGGAFIAVADDATAASWNPAGLIQLETPEISIVGAYRSRMEDATFLDFPDASGAQYISAFDLNYFSLAYPFNALETNFVASFNYQHLYDFSDSKQFNFYLSGPDVMLNVDETQKGSFKAISPAIAVQLTPFVSLGLTLNFWDNPLEDNKWEINQVNNGTGNLAGFPFTLKSPYQEENVIQGLSIDPRDPFHWQNINFNLGLLWEISPMLTVGAVLKSPFEASMQQHKSDDMIISFAPPMDVANVVSNPQYASGEVELTMPLSYGIGLAARFSDAFSVDFDLYRTEWSDYVLRDLAGNEINPRTGEPVSQGTLAATTQARIGAEYLFIGNTLIIPVRAGLFYDPEPVVDAIDDFYGLSLGTGVAYEKFIADIAYQYRFGNNIGKSMTGVQSSFQNMKQHTVYLSMIYHF